MGYTICSFKWYSTKTYYWVNLLSLFFTIVVLMFAEATILNATADWEKFRGPWDSECDGSFRAIAVHPTNTDIIYIGSSHPTKGCGIYKSIDGGRTWEAKNNGVRKVGILVKKHYLAVSNIALAQSKPNRLYFGTYGSDGSGSIYRSIDSGSTWSELSLKGGVLDLAVDPTDPNIVFAGIANQGVYRTLDGGTNWTRIKRVSPVAKGFYGDILGEYYHIVRVGGNDTLYIAGGSKYDDAPAVPLPTGATLDVSGSRPLGLLKSLDRGDNWVRIGTPEKVFLTDFVVDPSNPSNLYFSTMATGALVGGLLPLSIDNHGILKSVDGGNSWQTVNNAEGVELSDIPIYDLEIDPCLPNRLYALASDGIFLSTDGRYNWESIPLPQGVSMVRKIYASENKLYTFTQNGFYVYYLHPSLPQFFYIWNSFKFDNGNSVLSKREDTSDYSYCRFDFTLGSREIACFSMNGNGKYYVIFERHLLHMLNSPNRSIFYAANGTILMDREKCYTIPESKGDGEVVALQILLPAQPKVSDIVPGSLEWSRVEIEPSLPHESWNALYVVGQTPLPKVELIEDDTMLGVYFQSTNQNQNVVMFSRTGEIQNSVSFSITKSQAAVCYITGMQPNTGYNVNVATKRDDQTIAVSPGDTHISTNQGTLVFSVDLADNIQPATITDLKANTGKSPGSVDLTWTATGDDGNEGTATAYVIKYHTSEITIGNWDSANDVDGEPSPQPVGSTETFTVMELIAGQTYYFSIKARDEVGNISDVSNSPFAILELRDPRQPGKPISIEGPYDNDLVLEWFWAAPASGNVRYYNVYYSINRGTFLFYGTTPQTPTRENPFKLYFLEPPVNAKPGDSVRLRVQAVF